MIILGTYRTPSQFLARWVGRQAGRETPTDRWQDKGREVRGGRPGVGSRQNNDLARCAPQARSLRKPQNPCKSSLFRTSRRIVP